MANSRPRAKCTKVPGYHSWRAAKERCNCPQHISYPNYGGRGIKFSPAWNRFADFHADMGDRPEGYELDRIDNDGDYCAENCRWVSRSNNFQNKRNNVLLTYEDETLCLAEWARRVGIPEGHLRWRINKGWTTEKALSTPIRTKTLRD